MSVANLYCWGENFVPVLLLLLLSPSKRKNLELQRRARATLHISSHASHAAMTAASGDAATSNTPANPAVAQDAIPGILNDIVVTHVLRSEYFGDPADLARLPAVSRAMRDAVAATGLRFVELGEDTAVDIGCLSALLRLQLAGRLSRQEFLCEAAARSGQLEKLKLSRASSCPWDKRTCSGAARGGHLEVLQWLHAHGCPWDDYTCGKAAQGGHLEVLQWARANGAPWTEDTCSFAAEGGHLDILQWLRANGCPWDEQACT